MPSVLPINGMPVASIDEDHHQLGNRWRRARRSAPSPASDQRKRSAEVASEVARAPPSAGVPAPPDRRPVADDDGDRRGTRAIGQLEADERVEQEPTADQRGDQHDRPRRPRRRAAASGARRGRPPARRWCAASRPGRRGSAAAGSRTGRGTSRPAPRSAAAGGPGGRGGHAPPGRGSTTRIVPVGARRADPRRCAHAGGTDLALGGDDGRRRARSTRHRPTATSTSTSRSSAPG